MLHLSNVSHACNHFQNQMLTMLYPFIMAELGMSYDSSIYPVRHDLYGVPGAPRAPFIAGSVGGSILEIPVLAAIPRAGERPTAACVR